jgi:hypothetical protein
VAAVAVDFITICLAQLELADQAVAVMLEQSVQPKIKSQQVATAAQI